MTAKLAERAPQEETLPPDNKAAKPLRQEQQRPRLHLVEKADLERHEAAFMEPDF